MHFTFMPPLQHIAVVKIVTTLWIQDDVRAIIGFQMLHGVKPVTWNEAEKKLAGKVHKLPLPKFLKQKIIGAIKPMYNEIMLWGDYHCLCSPWFDLCTFNSTFNYLCWTSQGTVDKKKTAELWIESRDLCTLEQYSLVRMYCLIDKIQMISNQPHAEYCFDEQPDSVHCRMSKFAKDWIFYFETPETYEYARYLRAFLRTVDKGNQVAALYFWKKLAPEDKNDLLVKVIQHLALSRDINSGIDEEYYGEFLCFLLSKMTDEQQIELIKLRPYDVLRSLLDWPRQCFFLETAKRTWEFLPLHDYSKLLFTDILHKENKKYKDYDYLELFKDIWKLSPLTHKRYIFNEFSCLRPLFGLLFGIRDEQCAQWVLNDATQEEKHNLITCTEGQEICQYLIDAEKWDLLEFFMQKCVSSEDVLKTLERKLQVITLPQSDLWSTVNEFKVYDIFKSVEYYIQRNDQNESGIE